MDITFYKKYEPIYGKWYLNKEIGRGAFGVVFEAERRDMIKEKSAIKVVSIPSSQSEVEAFRQDHYTLDEKSVTSYFYGFVEEFLKEIKTMSLFQDHLNIVNIKDYEVKQRNDEIGWDIFIRMELLTPVNKYFAENGITEETVLKLGIDMCSALEECKKQNIIHRDIKPSNIFVSSNGDFKLGDFGVARTLEKTSSGFSKKGTYTYMAPEVYKGEDYDSSIDIYSLGIVMYKLLNNNFEPFKTGNSFTDEENALIRRMRGEKIVEGPANASAQLSKIVLKACSYDPEERFSNPAEMKRALEKLKNIIDEPKSQTDDEIINKVFHFIFNKLKTENGISIENNGSFVLAYKTKIKENIEQIKNGATVSIDLGVVSTTSGKSICLKTEICLVDGIVTGRNLSYENPKSVKKETQPTGSSEKETSAEEKKSKMTAGETALAILEGFLLILGIGSIISGLGPIGLVWLGLGLVVMLWDGSRKKKK